MIEISAYILCKLGGKSGSEDDIKGVLEAAGLTADDDQLSKLMSDMEGKELETLLAEGSETMKDVPFGGGGGGGGGGGAGAGGAAQAEAEKEEEPEEEEMAAPAMDMFGGDEKGGDY